MQKVLSYRLQKTTLFSFSKEQTRILLYTRILFRVLLGTFGACGQHAYNARGDVSAATTFFIQHINVMEKESKTLQQSYVFGVKIV